MIVPRLLAHLSNHYFSRQFAPHLNQPKAEIRAKLNKLYDAYQNKNMQQCLEIINEFSAFPGYPYYRNGNYWKHMYYVSRYFRKISGKKLPKIPVIATPKSASSYICVILSKLFDIPASILSIDHLQGNAPWVNTFGKWGGVTHEHYLPVTENLELLYRAGITRCIIHTRDPMETLISKAFHWTDSSNKKTFLLKAFRKINIGKNTDRILLARQYIDVNLEPVLQYHAEWLRRWRQAAASGKIEILETHYEDMKADPLTFFKRLLTFSGVTYSEQKLQQVLDNNSPSKKRKKYNFRKALKDEWKEVLTPEQTIRAKKVIDSEFSKLR